MPEAEFGSRRRQLSLIAASAVSVVAVVAIVAMVGHPWRDTAAPSPAADSSAPLTSSDSPLVSSATSPPVASASEPAFSTAPASPTATAWPTATASPTSATTAPPVSHTPAAARVASDSQLNVKFSVQVSPTQVVFGHPVHVTVTIANEGGVFNRWAEMFVQGTDPSDGVSDPPPTCTANGAIVCPITSVRPGRTWTFNFTFIPGTFPATDHFDDPLCAAFNYTDSHGQEQETPEYCAHVLLFNPPGSPPPASGAPSSTPPPSEPVASAPPSTSPAPRSTG